MIYQLLIIMLLIVLAGATAPIVIAKVLDRKTEVKKLVTANCYPKDIIA